jgi:protein-tyrosine phosphatase
MNELHPGCNKDIIDPWYGSEDGYYQVYHLIDAACEALVKKNETLPLN